MFKTAGKKALGCNYVFLITPDFKSELENAIQGAGFDIFVFSTEAGTTRRVFFDAVRNELPLDPPIVGSHSWDALEDSLWEGIDSRQSMKVAIIWECATRFAHENPQDYSTALSIFEDVAKSLTGGHGNANKSAKEVYFYIVRKAQRLE